MRYDLVNFTNIGDEDFIGKWGGEEYLVKKGETKAFPGFLAKHFTKHLVDSLLIKRGVQEYSNPINREPLEKQILGEVVVPKKEEKKLSEAKQVKIETEKAQKEFEELEELEKKEAKKASRKGKGAKGAK